MNGKHVLLLGGGGILADVIWREKNMKRVRRKRGKSKEEGRKRKY
jgi:hypothetical protein